MALALSRLWRAKLKNKFLSPSPQIDCSQNWGTMVASGEREEKYSGIGTAMRRAVLHKVKTLQRRKNNLFSNVNKIRYDEQKDNNDNDGGGDDGRWGAKGGS